MSAVECREAQTHHNTQLRFGDLIYYSNVLCKEITDLGEWFKFTQISTPSVLFYESVNIVKLAFE